MQCENGTDVFMLQQGDGGSSEFYLQRRLIHRDWTRYGPSRDLNVAHYDEPCVPYAHDVECVIVYESHPYVVCLDAGATRSPSILLRSVSFLYLLPLDTDLVARTEFKGRVGRGHEGDDGLTQCLDPEGSGWIGRGF